MIGSTVTYKLNILKIDRRNSDILTSGMIALMSIVCHSISPLFWANTSIVPEGSKVYSLLSSFHRISLAVAVPLIFTWSLLTPSRILYGINTSDQTLSVTKIDTSSAVT